MRVQPIIQSYNKNKNHINQTAQYERKVPLVSSYRPAHQYTGVASTDLAYASMFDSAIAKDLKLMGLI